MQYDMESRRQYSSHLAGNARDDDFMIRRALEQLAGKPGLQLTPDQIKNAISRCGRTYYSSSLALA